MAAVSYPDVSYLPTPEEVDYSQMDPGAMYQFLGHDALRWTDAMLQLAPEIRLGRETLHSWACNLIMAGYDAGLAACGQRDTMSGPYT